MNDYMVRAIAAHDQIRAFAITDKGVVQTARNDHDTWPVTTAALGRTLSAGLMMGFMMDGENDEITVQLIGDGPAGGVTVTADSQGHAKGFVNNPHVDLPEKSPGHLDVGGAIGHGYLRVIKDMGLKDPYVGQVELISGEIAEDLAYYFTSSEQVPSAVSLGVLMEKNNTVKQAGGLIIQALPGAVDEELTMLEERLTQLPSMTQMLEDEHTPEEILEKILGDMELQILDRIDTAFYCNCDRQRVEKVVISLGRDELGKIIAEGEPLQLKCHFCNKAYDFSDEELKALGRKLGIK